MTVEQVQREKGTNNMGTDKQIDDKDMERCTGTGG